MISIIIIYYNTCTIGIRNVFFEKVENYSFGIADLSLLPYGKVC